MPAIPSLAGKAFNSSIVKVMVASGPISSKTGSVETSTVGSGSSVGAGTAVGSGTSVGSTTSSFGSTTGASTTGAATG